MVQIVKELIIYGKASNKKILVLSVPPRYLKSNLMDFLRDHGIPIASSCGGDGICLKCVVEAHGEKILSCMTSIEEVLKNSDSVQISISYL